MHVNVLFNMRENIVDLDEWIQSLCFGSSRTSPIDEDICGAMAVDLSTRLNVVEEHVQQIGNAIEQSVVPLSSNVKGSGLAKRVSKIEQQLIAVEAQLRDSNLKDSNLKQSGSNHGIQNLQEENVELYKRSIHTILSSKIWQQR
jgi:hypothetical protein